MAVRASKRLKLPDIFPLPSQCSQYDLRPPQKARWDLDWTPVCPIVPFGPLRLHAPHEAERIDRPKP